MLKWETVKKQTCISHKYNQNKLNYLLIKSHFNVDMQKLLKLY